MAWPVNANHVFIAVSIYMFFLDWKLLETKFCSLTQKIVIEMILVCTLSHKCTNCNSRCWKIDSLIIFWSKKAPASRPEIDPVWPHNSWPCFEYMIGLNDLLNFPETWIVPCCYELQLLHFIVFLSLLETKYQKNIISAVNFFMHRCVFYIYIHRCTNIGLLQFLEVSKMKSYPFQIYLVLLVSRK